MAPAIPRPIPVELSANARMAGRIKRLGFVSLVALGLIWTLAVASLETPRLVKWALAAGWVLMPTILFASLSRPLLRYGLVLPGSLVGLGLLAICAWWLPADPLAAAGWLLITVGVSMGSALGLWFWFRLLPVPASLDDPYSTGRLGLIRVHIALIVAGLGLASTGLIRG